MALHFLYYQTKSRNFSFWLLSKLELRDLNGVNLPSFPSTLPSYDTQSKLTKMPNLGDFDINENFLQPMNSKYLNVHNLSKLSINKKDLSLFHVNLRSLTANFDELHTLLENLKIPFDFIGITETKQHKDNDFLTNVTIQNYNMYCQSSLSHAGGVALYFKSNLACTSRLDLSVTEQQYEAVWTELKNPKSKSILCCCTYRHLNTDIFKFTKYLSSYL